MDEGCTEDPWILRKLYTEMKMGTFFDYVIMSVYTYMIYIYIYRYLLGQWLNFKLFGITYLVGKIKFKLLFQGPLAK